MAVDFRWIWRRGRAAANVFKTQISLVGMHSLSLRRVITLQPTTSQSTLRQAFGSPLIRTPIFDGSPWNKLSTCIVKAEHLMLPGVMMEKSVMTATVQTHLWKIVRHLKLMLLGDGLRKSAKGRDISNAASE
jgi:hypothetical protein